MCGEEGEVAIPKRYALQANATILFYAISRGGSNCKFWEKNPQVHLIFIRE